MLEETCQLWLNDDDENIDNFWGGLYTEELSTLRSGDFKKRDLLSLLGCDSEYEEVLHNFPTDGILYRRCPLPACVLFEHQRSLPGDTRSALGCQKTIHLV